MSSKINKIGVLTSGGDSPGMNAAIRAVVRAGLYNKMEVIGIKRGYEGLIDGDMEIMGSPSVSNIIQRGGTILRSARSERFFSEEGRKLAYEQLTKAEIDGLVVIGGDGTFNGAVVISREFNIPVIGIPGTIDNDLFGTDYTIGYDTALNTAVEAIDKIRDTAAAHDRLFFVEVMGRDAGFIAIRSGLAGGAEAILLPEQETEIDELIKTLEIGRTGHKSSSIVVVAEGDDGGGALEAARKVNEKYDYYDTRVVILGHLQRGGSPTCHDRVIASRFGVAAVDGLLNGEKNVMTGIQHKDIVYVPMEKAVKHNREMNMDLLRVAKIMAS